MSDDTFFVLCFLVALLHIGMAIACHGLAKEKGHESCGAGLAGLVFGLVALLYYVGAPDRHARDYLRRIAASLQTMGHPAQAPQSRLPSDARR